MKKRIFVVTLVTLCAAGVAVMRAAKPAAKPAVVVSRGPSVIATPLVLPSEKTAKTVLNSTPRHREWDNVTVNGSKIWAFVVYPERSDRAPVVMVTAKNQGASDWIRAVADQVAADGFIAVVPDVLSGLGPKGGDTESFSSPDAIKKAIVNMDRGEIEVRTSAVLAYAVALPAANGMSASLDLDSLGGRVVAAVDQHADAFPLNDREWTKALDFLTTQTNNHPIFGANTMAEEHAGHDHTAMMMALAQASPQASESRGGGANVSLADKRPDLPANYYTAQSAVAHSKLRKEWIDIPLGDMKLHTRIEYPAGNGKAPIVIAMQHGTGLDNWMLGVVDQLASQGFIAVAPDIWSGTLPAGANRDYASTFPDDAMKAGPRSTPMRRCAATRPRANMR